RILDLDRHLAAVTQAAPVDLRQRRRGDRRRLEGREHLVETSAELALEVWTELLERTRRHAVLELGEDLDVLRGQDVGTRAEELADLDRQPLEPGGEPVGRLGAAAVVAGVVTVGAREPDAPERLMSLVAAVHTGDERRLRREAMGPRGEHGAHCAGRCRPRQRLAIHRAARQAPRAEWPKRAPSRWAIV